MENQISQEIALAELRIFVKEHTRKELDDDKLLEQYPSVVSAMESGNLILGESPKLKLFKPVKNDEGDDAVSDVDFKTRILPAEQRKIAAGLDLKKDGLLYGHRCMTFIAQQQTVNMLDKFSKHDYSVIEQLSTLFI